MSGTIAFERAGPEHEADIRMLLREVALGGQWSIALAREPDGFGGPHLPGERQDFVIARDAATREAVGLCERVVRPAYIGGSPVALPYLGALRIAPSHRNRLSILRGGFAALREQCERPGDFPLALTSITSDNSPARRLLTAGLRGLPTYSWLSDYSTFALRPRRFSGDPEIGLSTSEDTPALSAFLCDAIKRRDAATVWTHEALGAIEGARFLILREAGEITGCACVWDQRATRQTILAGGPRAAMRLRVPANALAALVRLPRIPRLGEPVEQVFLSHLASREDCPVRVIRLVRAGLAQAHSIGAAAAVLGVPSRHPWRTRIRDAFRTIEYRTSLFAVGWPGSEEAIKRINTRRLFPEVALL